MKRMVEFDTAIGTANLGDEIILESLREQLKFLYDDCFVMRFGTHLKNFPTYRVLIGGQKLDFIAEADYKIIMGTNLLSRDIRRTRSQWPVCGTKGWIYEDSILAGVGTTLDNGRLTRYSRRFYERTLRKDFCHSVRDEASKAFLEGLGYRAINTGCPTLWKITPELCASIPRAKASRVVFSLSGFNTQQDRKRDRQLLDVLQKNYKHMYFWCQTARDEIYLDTFPGVEDIPRIHSLSKYADLLDEGDIDYVGTRLHGGIMAIQHGVRTIVISIDHRARGFHETNNLVICERNEIDSRLDGMINDSFETSIVIDASAIADWKAQFQNAGLKHNPYTYRNKLTVRFMPLVFKAFKALRTKYYRLRGEK